MNRSAVIVAVVACTGMQCQRLVRADLRETFLQEAPLAWNKIRKGPPYFQGTVIETSKAVKPGMSPSASYRTQHDFAFAEGRLLRHTKLLEGSPWFEWADVINPDNAFRLKRSSEKDEWTIRHVGGAGAVVDWLHKTAQEVYLSTTIDLEPLPWLVNQPGFKALDARDVSKDGAKLVEVKFASTAVFRPDYVITGGTITFDIGRLWAVRDYLVNIRLDIPGTMEGHIEYDPVRTNYPVPVRAVKVQKFGGTTYRNYDFEFPKFEEATAPDSAFRLTAFGLPEPEGHRSNSLWLWALVVAAICFVAVLVVSRMRAKGVSQER